MAQPTTEPVEERILQTIESALLSIDPADVTTDYWNKIYYVYRMNTGFPDIAAYPAIVMIPGGTQIDESISSGQHSVVVHRLFTTLLCYIDEQTDVAKKLMRFSRDVRTALQVDPRRNDGVGDLAIHTYITRTQPYFSDGEQENTSLIEIDVEVTFRTSTTALEEAH